MQRSDVEVKDGIVTSIEGSVITITHYLNAVFNHNLAYLKHFAFEPDEHTTILKSAAATKKADIIKLLKSLKLEAQSKGSLDIAAPKPDDIQPEDEAQKKKEDADNKRYKLALDDAQFELVCKLIESAKQFFAALESKTSIGNRNYYAREFLKQLDDLWEKLGDKTFADTLDLLHRCSGDEMSCLRVITLACCELNRHADIIKRFIFAEMIGHNVCYKVAQNEGKINKLILRGLDMQITDTFSVQEIIVKKANSNERNQVLKGVILTPVYADGAPDVPTIYIAWPGTDLKNAATLRADFEKNAGEESYRAAEDQIMRQVLLAIRNFKAYCAKPIRVIICGHSLGAALSQLNYHSMQRILAANIQTDPLVMDEMAKLELEFKEKLEQAVPAYLVNKTVKSISEMKLSDYRLSDKDLIELGLDIWNPTGVLRPIEEHSNKLLYYLKQHAAMLNGAYIGSVGGDPIQLTGDRSLFSDILFDPRKRDLTDNQVSKNALVHMLKIEPSTARAGLTALGVVGGIFLGALLASLISMTLVGGAVATVASVIAIIKTRLDAHTKKHFENVSKIFEIPYRLFSSQHQDGSFNMGKETGWPKIQEQLMRRSHVYYSTTKNWFSHLFGLDKDQAPGANPEAQTEEAKQTATASTAELAAPVETEQTSVNKPALS